MERLKRLRAAQISAAFAKESLTTAQKRLATERDHAARLQMQRSLERRSPSPPRYPIDRIFRARLERCAAPASANTYPQARVQGRVVLRRTSQRPPPQALTGWEKQRCPEYVEAHSRGGRIGCK